MNRPLAAKHQLLNRLHYLRKLVDDAESAAQTDDLIDTDELIEAVGSVVEAGATWNAALIARAAG